MYGTGNSWDDLSVRAESKGGYILIPPIINLLPQLASTDYTPPQHGCYLADLLSAGDTKPKALEVEAGYTGKSEC